MNGPLFRCRSGHIVFTEIWKRCVPQKTEQTNAFQIVGLRHIEQHRMVRRLLPNFNQMEIAVRIECGAGEHGKKILLADVE